VFIDKFREVNHDFRSTMHQDAHEFLNFLLNRIVEEIEQERKAVVPGEPSSDDRAPV
jgi:ubiquitin carboxyl-terminal hydrolase 9/13